MKKRILVSVFSIVICLLISAQSIQKTVVYLKNQPKIETLSSLIDSITFVSQKSSPIARGIVIHQANAKKTVFAASNVDSLRVIEPNTLVITHSISDLTNTSVNCKGVVSPNISSTIYERGFVWSKTTNPTYDANLGKTTNGTQSGEYSALISGLSTGVRYYVRAYAVTGTATLYGDEISFVPGVLPTVTTDSIKSVYSTTANGFLYTQNKGLPVYASGFVWDKQPNPTIESNLGLSLSSSSNTSVINTIFINNLNLFNLSPANEYYVRGFASNYWGVAYSSAMKITTSLYPEVMNTITEITVNSAKSNNNIATGGLPVLSRGVVWGKHYEPTLTNNLGKTDDGKGDGAFVSTLSGLTGNTDYYIRTYATVSCGTTYSVQKSFKTSPILATITTDGLETISANAATIQATIVNDGGGIATSGICWSTTIDPTINDNKISSGYVMGSFSVNITGLLYNTTYYARAYAINSAGISYGASISFKTLDGIAVLTSTAATTITAISATLGGNITNYGGATITERGVCWSATPTPTVLNNKVTSGSYYNPYTVTVTGLTNNTTYYYRAYVTNIVGTFYGNEVSFKTLNGIATLNTTVASNITINSATIGGNITADGGATITERGICWSTTTNPTITNYKTASGNGTGTFTVSATGLKNKTTYYVRAYAINSIGTSYGSEISFVTL